MCIWNSARNNWTTCGTGNCQHYNEQFPKSNRHFSSEKTIRNCPKNPFIRTKTMVRNNYWEWLLYSSSTRSIYLYVCKLQATKYFSTSVKGEGFTDCQNSIAMDRQEKSITHWDSLLTYLSRRQSVDSFLLLHNRRNSGLEPI